MDALAALAQHLRDEQAMVQLIKKRDAAKAELEAASLRLMDLWGLLDDAIDAGGPVTSIAKDLHNTFDDLITHRLCLRMQTCAVRDSFAAYERLLAQIQTPPPPVAEGSGGEDLRHND